MADANMGFGARQPGSWYFSILPYIEEQATHDLNKGITVNPIVAGVQQATLQLNQTPVTIFNCPSRRRAAAYPSSWGSTLQTQLWLKNVNMIKGDYAANAGDSYVGAGDDYNGKVMTTPALADYPALKN